MFAAGSSNPATGASATVPAKPHVPVFILVSGHMERGMDARQLWGANGFLQSVVQATTTVVTEVVSTVVGAEEALKEVAISVEENEKEVRGTAEKEESTPGESGLQGSNFVCAYVPCIIAMVVIGSKCDMTMIYMILM